MTMLTGICAGIAWMRSGQVLQAAVMLVMFWAVAAKSTEADEPIDIKAAELTYVDELRRLDALEVAEAEALAKWQWLSDQYALDMTSHETGRKEWLEPLQAAADAARYAVSVAEQLPVVSEEENEHLPI